MADSFGWIPSAVLIGLNGVILVAYIVAIPANEIVIPTVLMLTVLCVRASDVGAGEGAGVMFELDSVTRNRGAAPRGRLDSADRHQPDAVQPAAQPLLHHDLHDLERNAKCQVDRRGHAAPPGTGIHHLFLRGADLVSVGGVGSFRPRHSRHPQESATVQTFNVPTAAQRGPRNGSLAPRTRGTRRAVATVHKMAPTLCPLSRDGFRYTTGPKCGPHCVASFFPSASSEANSLSERGW